MDVRTLLALLLLVAVLAVLALPRPATPGGPGEARVVVVGPAGVLAIGNVSLHDATALAALLALAQDQDVAVAWDDRPGCTFDYVRGIGDLHETTTGGWNFYLDRAGAWQWQPASASCTSLQDGQGVLWCWVESDGPCPGWT